MQGILVAHRHSIGGTHQQQTANGTQGNRRWPLPSRSGNWSDWRIDCIRITNSSLANLGLVSSASSKAGSDHLHFDEQHPADLVLAEHLAEPSPAGEGVLLPAFQIVFKRLQPKAKVGLDDLS